MPTGQYRPLPIDWAYVYARLIQDCYLKPWEIPHLTDSEIDLHLMRLDGGPMPDGPGVSDEDVWEYARKWKAMTPRERLEAVKRGEM